MKIMRIIFLLIISVTYSACASEVQPNSIVDFDYFCKKIEDIKYVPMKSEITTDSAYNGLIASGVQSLECLISRIDEQKLIESPINKPPFRGKVQVGVLSQYILNRVLELPAWAKDYQSDRKELKQKLTKWFDENRLELTSPSVKSKCVNPDVRLKTNVCRSSSAPLF